MNKKNIAIGLLSASLLFTGCGANSSEVITDDSKNVAISTRSDVTDLSTEDVSINEESVETIGEIIGFGDNSIDILTGDIAEVYSVSNDQHKNFYLGQTVYVTKETDTEYSLMPYIKDDFTIRHTSMGQMILRITGEVIAHEDNNITVMTDEGEKVFELTEDTIVEIGNTYEFDVIFFNENEQLVTKVYSENDKIQAIIDDLTRNDDGELIIHATSSNGTEYIIPTYMADKNFNLSDLSVGMNIDFYAQIITKSIPAQATATRISISSSLDIPRGTTSIEGEAIGEVIEIDGNDVHVLSGDIVEIFTIGKEHLESIHLGETVKLFMKNDTINIEPYIIEDFSVRMTGWGMMVTNYVGEIIEVNDDEHNTQLTVNIDGEKVTMNYYGDVIPQVGMTYEIDAYGYDPSQATHAELFDLNTIVKITIEELNRSDNGELMISGIDAEGGKYVIGTSNPYKNFNISELKEGDVIAVYADAIMESWPMQVVTRKILLVTE